VTLMIYLSWDEAVRAEEFAETLLDRLIWRLPFRSGFRAHEVADARIEHIDPEQEWIYIPHGHRNGARYACVDKETLRLLVIYVGSRKKGPLLIRYDMRPISRHIVYYSVTSTAEKACLVKAKRVGPLMLRHTFATTWLKRRGNIRLLQKQLGHEKLESTAYYLDWMPEEVREEYDSLFNQREELATVTAS